MKKLLLTACFAFSILSFGFAQCVCSTQYPAGTVTPTTVWTTINTLMYAGDYAVVNVTAGNTYEFSTCAASGSNVTYDSELTLLTNAQQLLVYNDDFCGVQSQLSWVATYTGTVQIHLTEYYLGAGCYTNSTPSSIRYRFTAGAVTVPANNACANATALTPAANCNLTSGTTIGATEDPYPDPSCDLPGVYNDVWYTFNSGAFTSLNLTVNLGTAALIGVEFYSGCGTLAAGLSLDGTPGNCDFNTNAPNPSVITGLTPNTTYRMRMFTNASYDTPGTFTTCLTTPPPPTVSVNSTSVCAGQSVTLTATPSTAGGTYLWSNGATTPTITVTPNATTSYSVTYSNNGTASGSGTVTVNPAPSINGGQDQTVCQGASVTLSGTGGVSYTWDNGVANGLPFTPINTNTYTVTGTDANGCQGTDQVTVTVNASPTVNAINSQTLCAGASASAVTFSGTAGATYAWVNSNPSIGLSASGSGNIAGFTATNATTNPITGTITVTPSQAGCTGTPQTYSYSINPNPSITGNNPLCAGATLQLTGSGTAAANNAWVSGTPANGTVSNTGLVTGLNAGNTIITYTNANGCTATQTVTVNASPTISGNTVICPNTTSQLTGTGAPAGNNAWSSSNTGIATVSNTGLVSAVSFGTATITYTASTGCSGTTTVNVTNPTAPTFNPIAAVCSGGLISLPGTSTNNIQGTWTPAVNNTQTTTYTFTPSAGQCATTAQQTVNVNQLPTINAGQDQTVCQGANVTLSGTGGSTYIWNNGVSNGVAFVPNTTTTYTVTGTDANGCANTDQVTVTVAPTPTLTGNTVLCPNTSSQLTANANPAASNAWTSSNTAIATISNTGLVNALSFGTSTITFTNNNGCTAMTTINVTNPIAPTFNPISAVCAGGSITLPVASTNNVQGTWSPAINNTQTTTYTFTPSAGQCATTAQQTVTVNPNPSISGGGNVCVGSTLQLTGSGTPAVSTPWTSGTAAIGSVSNNGLFTALSAGSSLVTYTNSDGCSASTTVTVQGAVNALPVQVTACLSYLWNGQTYSQSGTYSDTLQTVAGCDSIISLNLTISNSITGPTTQQNSCGPFTWNGQTYAQSGTYTFNGTTANGCDSSATLVLTIDQAPSNVQVSLNQGTFTATAQNATNFAWMDCATNTLIPGETSATFTPTLSGSYAAVVSNACGSDTTTCEPIEVQGISEMDNELIAVYPNPSAGIFTVASKGSIIQEVFLYSINGELIWKKSYNTDEITLDLNGFARGTYMVHVSTNRQAQIFRLIKQ
ncbi:MAG: Ig-like domain-containing protein [Crocinitomicaceae bacterium]|nr:Ig-like domain-containing protein [Crocinitomicaceae bacterium]